MLDRDWIVHYITSIYWSFVTTLTIGYGDLVPSTNLEKIFVIIIILFMCGIFGYVISNIGEIFKGLKEH